MDHRESGATRRASCAHTRFGSDPEQVALAKDAAVVQAASVRMLWITPLLAMTTLGLACSSTVPKGSQFGTPERDVGDDPEAMTGRLVGREQAGHPPAQVGAVARQDVDGESECEGGSCGAQGTAFHVYVSGYGSDVHLLSLDTVDGELAGVESYASGRAPSYMAFSPDRRFAYAVNEAQGDSSVVVAWAVNAASGALSELNRARTGGDGAPHLAVHPSGRWLVVAHYSSGHISVLPIRENGSVGAPTTVERGPDDGCRRAHQAVFVGDGSYLFVPCLGSDHVIQYRFGDDGTLAPNEPATVAIPNPRHMAFAADEKRAFVLSEYDSTVTVLEYRAESGVLHKMQVVKSYDETAGSSAAIHLHPNGRFLYVSNRVENSLGIFALGNDGSLAAVAFEKRDIRTPREFGIDPSGETLIIANQGGGEELLLYRVAQDTGRLTRLGQVEVGDQPTFVGFIPAPAAD